MKELISLDCSLNHIGISSIPLNNNYNKIKYISLINNHEGRFNKQFKFVNDILNSNLIKSNSSILIEGYAYGTRGKDTNDSLYKEMMGLLFYKLIECKNCLIYIISSSAVKNWAIGNSKGLSKEEKQIRRKNLKSNTVKFVESKINSQINIKLKPKNSNSIELLNYNSKSLLSKDKIRFEDIADSLLNGLYFIENEYWKKTECYKNIIGAY